MQLSFTGFNFDELTPLNLFQIHRANVDERDHAASTLLDAKPFSLNEYRRVCDRLRAKCDLSWRAYEQFSRAESGLIRYHYKI